MIFFASLLCAAHGQSEPQDAPHLWTRGLAAVVLNPSGVLVDFAAEARAPVLRVGGPINNMTFVGAGARVAVSPVHAEYVARTTIQLIDILPVTLEGFYGSYWNSPWGALTVDQVSNQRPSERRPRYKAGEGFGTRSYGFTVSPTFQIAAGPMVAFSNFSFTWVTMNVPESDDPWVFEPYRGVVMEPSDRVMDHNSAILWQPMDGKDRALLRVGPVIRGRVVKKTTDETLEVGAMAQWRPAPTTDGASIAFIVTPYAKDPDFQGWAPHVFLLVSMARLTPFKK